MPIAPSPYFAEMTAMFPGVVEVERDIIIIQPAGIYDPLFISGRVPDGDCVEFNIRTETDAGKRHPVFEKFRASTIAAEAIRHFAQYGTVPGIDFTWCEPEEGKRSVNYTQYLERRRLAELTTSYEEAQRAAAMSTWTARYIALQNGYGRLDDVYEIGSRDAPSRVTGTIWRS